VVSDINYIVRLHEIKWCRTNINWSYWTDKTCKIETKFYVTMYCNRVTICSYFSRTSTFSAPIYVYPASRHYPRRDARFSGV